MGPSWGRQDPGGPWTLLSGWWWCATIEYRLRSVTAYFISASQIPILPCVFIQIILDKKGYILWMFHYALCPWAILHRTNNQRTHGRPYGVWVPVSDSGAGSSSLPPYVTTGQLCSRIFWTNSFQSHQTLLALNDKHKAMHKSWVQPVQYIWRYFPCVSRLGQ